MTTSCVLIQTDSPATHTPSPGADCPAIVMYGARIISGVFSRIIPATLNTMMRGPPCSQASRNVPGPLSSKLVTTITLPPLPPKLYLPPPSAPGNAGISACGKSVGRPAHGIYGFPCFAYSSITGRALPQATSDCSLARSISSFDAFFTSSGTFGYCPFAVSSDNKPTASRKPDNTFLFIVYIQKLKV